MSVLREHSPDPERTEGFDAAAHRRLQSIGPRSALDALIDQSAALAAIPSMLPPRPREAPPGSGTDQARADSRGALPPEGEKRLQEITALFVADEGKPPAQIVNLKSINLCERPGRESRPS